MQAGSWCYWFPGRSGRQELRFVVIGPLPGTERRQALCCEDYLDRTDIARSPVFRSSLTTETAPGWSFAEPAHGRGRLRQIRSRCGYTNRLLEETRARN